jgi:hypothetical protein
MEESFHAAAGFCVATLMSAKTKSFVGITVSIGFMVLGSAVWHWQSADLTRFLCYLAVAVLA